VIVTLKYFQGLTLKANRKQENWREKSGT